ncbi:MAG: hypothetical protein ACR2OZ_08525 [Verrucomicrobiales bacterium]
MLSRFFKPITLAAVLLSFGSCTTDYYGGPDGNIFLDRRHPPRYGHGGTDSPHFEGMEEHRGTRRPRAEARGDVGAGSAGSTEYLERRERDRARSTDADDDRSTRDEDEDARRTAGERTSRENSSNQEEATSSEKPASSSTDGNATKSGEGNLPFGVPVPGKDGLVYSPYFSGGYVDVKGMPPGSKARCPYSKKVFRVP